CRHVIEYCATCLGRWLSSQLRTLPPAAIPCLEEGCDSMLSLEDMDGYLSFEDFERSRMRYLATLFGGFLCPVSGCGTAIPKDDEVNFATCGGCHKQICVSCRTAWHSGIDCREFQAELVRRAGERAREDERLAQEAEARARRAGKEIASIRYKQAKTALRPSCRAPFEKVGGCDHMRC
ncbi:hypothetical protein G647_04392, partial [Cladophialophora carrionii CBS 160.54]